MPLALIMPFAIITKDKPDHAELRAAYQAEHKSYLDRNKRLLLAAGAMLKDDGLTAHGGLLVVDRPSREAAHAFVENDPFWAAGLFEEVVITRWRKAFFNGERLVDL